MSGIERVLVVGAGTMGSGIAQAAATAGYQTTMVDTTPELVEAGFQKIRKPLEKRIADGKMARADFEKLLSNLKGSTDMEAPPRRPTSSSRPSSRSSRSRRNSSTASPRSPSRPASWPPTPPASP